METILLAVELVLDQPLPFKKLCKAFQEHTGASLTKVCSPANPLDVLASFPNRFVVTGTVVRRALIEMSESDWLAAAARAIPKTDDLAESFAKCLQENLCFDCKVHLGGSAGRGTSTAKVGDADIVLLFETGPRKAAKDWAPPVLAALEAMIAMVPFEYHGEEMPVLVLGSRGDSYLTVKVGSQQMKVWVCPEIHRQHLKTIDWRSANAQYLAPGLDRPFTLWVRSQSTTVKHTMRLVKEWSASLSWSCAYHTPSAEYLELVVIHCAIKFPQDAGSIGSLMQRVHAEFRHANDLVVKWEKPIAWYDEESVAAAPVVRDPFHPGRNHADPSAFDATELAKYACAARDLLVCRHCDVDTESTASSFVSATSSAPSDISGPSTTAPSDTAPSDLSDMCGAASAPSSTPLRKKIEAIYNHLAMVV